MRKITIERVDRAAWAERLEGFDERTPFHGLPWLDALARARSMTVVLAAATSGTYTLALWPVLAMRRGPLRVLGSPLPGTSTAYLGPLVRRDADPDRVLGAFLADDLLRRHAYFGCRTVGNGRAPDLAPHGFTRIRTLETYVVDLTASEETLWGNLKGECRTRIRKARALGIEVRHEHSEDFISEFWRHTLETFERSGARPTHDEALVRAVWHELHPRGEVLALSAFLDGERLATLVLPHDGRTMVYWAGATAQARRDLPSNNLLHWEAICEARRRGLESYDLISVHGGPGRFKRTFGPRHVEIGAEWERSPSPWLAFLKRRYEWLKRRQLGIARKAA